MNKIWRDFSEFVVFCGDCIPIFINLLALVWLIGIPIFLFENSKEILAIPEKAASQISSLTSEVKELRKEVSKFNSCFCLRVLYFYKSKYFKKDGRV